jgi:hypothetical protein
MWFRQMIDDPRPPLAKRPIILLAASIRQGGIMAAGRELRT